MITARAALESLLRDRKLDVTLTSNQAWEPEPEDRVTSSGIPAIDQPLRGGLRRGHLSEIVGPRSSGRMTVLCGILASATARGEVVALIDSCDRFDPVSAAQAGVDLSRLLWIRERGDATRALKAVNLIVQAGGFGVVAFDLADVPSVVIRQFPYTTWMRLSRVIEGSQTTLVLLGADRIARSPGGITVALERANRASSARWAGAADRARVLARVEVSARARVTCDVRRAMC